MLLEAVSRGVFGALVPSYGPGRWSRQSQLLLEPGEFQLWGGFGLHPWALAPGAKAVELLSELECGWREHALLWGDRLKAVGEFGLDRSRRMAEISLDLQRTVFGWHLQKARLEQLPLIVHLVRADGPGLDLLGQNGEWQGVVHGFSSHAETVPTFLKTGLCLSFGSALLSSDKVRNALRATPPDRFMFETDAPRPAVAPEGKPWGPGDLIEIVRAASQATGKSVEYLLARHRENCARVFRLPLIEAARTERQL